MAVDGTVSVGDVGTKKVDVTELTRDDGTVVERQRIHIAGSDPAALLELRLRAPAETDYSLPTRSRDAARTNALLALVLQELRAMNPNLRDDTPLPQRAISGIGLTGTINGTTGSDGNALFGLPSTPATGYPVRAELNGVGLINTIDFTVTGRVVTMLAPNVPMAAPFSSLTAGDRLVVDYYAP